MFGSRLLEKLKRLKSSRRGSTAIEFAFVALPTIALLLGTVQLGIIYLTNQTLEEAVTGTARLIKTGQTSNSGANVNTIKGEMCRLLVFVADCEQNLDISVRAFGSVGDIDTNDLFQNGLPLVNNEFNLGSPNDIVVVSAAVEFPIIFSLIPASYDSSVEAGTDRSFERLLATSVVQNEQYEEN